MTLLPGSQKLSPRAARLWLLFRPSLIHFLLGFSCRNFATLARATGSIKQRRKELHSHLPRPSLAKLAAQFCCPNPIFSLDRKPLLESTGGETQNLLYIKASELIPCQTTRISLHLLRVNDDLLGRTDRSQDIFARTCQSEKNSSRDLG